MIRKIQVRSKKSKIISRETKRFDIDYHKRKMKLLARFVGILSGLFWLFFGLMEPFYGFTGFFMNILPGIVLMLCTDAAWRYGFTGIFLLLLIGLVSTLILSFYGYAIIALVAGLPPLLSGFLFLIGWYEKE